MWYVTSDMRNVKDPWYYLAATWIKCAASSSFSFFNTDSDQCKEAFFFVYSYYIMDFIYYIKLDQIK